MPGKLNPDLLVSDVHLIDSVEKRGRTSKATLGGKAITQAVLSADDWKVKFNIIRAEKNVALKKATQLRKDLKTAGEEVQALKRGREELDKALMRHDEVVEAIRKQKAALEKEVAGLKAQLMSNASRMALAGSMLQL